MRHLLSVVVGVGLCAALGQAQIAAQPLQAPLTIHRVTVQPDSGVLTISGTGLGSDLTVMVDGQPATVLPGATHTPLEVIAPAMVLTTPGTYRLTVVDPARQVGDGFVVGSQAGRIVAAGGPSFDVAPRAGPTPAIGRVGDRTSRELNSSTVPLVTENACLTAVGLFALASNPGGVCNNTAVGREALYWNTGGTYNTAIGDFALNSNTTGGTNTASGARALERNTTGHDNTATGASALRFNTAGGANTASGAYALYNNNTGGGNTASGFHALEWNTGGSQNTATGFSALLSNTTGIQNVASGASALRSNQSGFSNSAHGSFALYFNETGARNTASGQGALSSTRSNNNTGIGYNSGAASVFGTYNIYLGADVLGTTDDANTMRLGLPYDGVSGAGQNRTFIAGIHGTQRTGSYLQVVVDANGQLGTLTPPAQLSGGATATPLSMLQQQVQEQQVTIAAQQATIEDLLVRLARLEAASRGARRP